MDRYCKEQIVISKWGISDHNKQLVPFIMITFSGKVKQDLLGQVSRLQKKICTLKVILYMINTQKKLYGGKVTLCLIYFFENFFSDL
jgi:hypothetical protein